MGGKFFKKVPHFHGLRIYLSSIILYYGLVLPFILILYIKYAPKFDETRHTRISQSGVPFDSLSWTNKKTGIKLPNNANVELISDSISEDLENNADVNADSTAKKNIEFSPAPGIQIKAEGVENEINESKQISDSFNFLFNLLLISFFLGFIFNLPFKDIFHVNGSANQYLPSFLNSVKNTYSFLH